MVDQVGEFVATPDVTIAGVGPYTVTHEYSNKADLEVVVVKNATETILVLDVDYTVDPEDYASTGAVTLSAGAAALHAGATLTIRRDTAVTQQFLGSTGREIGLMRGLNRIVMAIQDGLADFSRSLKLSSGPGATIAMPTAAGQYQLFCDPDRNPPFYLAQGAAGGQGSPVSVYMQPVIAAPTEAAFRQAVNLEPGVDVASQAAIAELPILSRAQKTYPTVERLGSGPNTVYTVQRVGQPTTPEHGETFWVLCHQSKFTGSPVYVQLTADESGSPFTVGPSALVNMKTGGLNNGGMAGEYNPIWSSGHMIELECDISIVDVEGVPTPLTQYFVRGYRPQIGFGGNRIVHRDPNGFIPKSGFQLHSTWQHSVDVPEVVFSNLDDVIGLKVNMRGATTSAAEHVVCQVSDDNGVTWYDQFADYEGHLTSGSYEAGLIKPGLATLPAIAASKSLYMDIMGFGTVPDHVPALAATGCFANYEGQVSGQEYSGSSHTVANAHFNAIRFFSDGGANFTGGSIELWAQK